MLKNTPFSKFFYLFMPYGLCRVFSAVYPSCVLCGKLADVKGKKLLLIREWSYELSTSMKLKDNLRCWKLCISFWSVLVYKGWRGVSNPRHCTSQGEERFKRISKHGAAFIFGEGVRSASNRRTVSGSYGFWFSFRKACRDRKTGRSWCKFLEYCAIQQKCKRDDYFAARKPVTRSLVSSAGRMIGLGISH